LVSLCGGGAARLQDSEFLVIGRGGEDGDLPVAVGICWWDGPEEIALAVQVTDAEAINEEAVGVVHEHGEGEELKRMGGADVECLDAFQLFLDGADEGLVGAAAEELERFVLVPGFFPW
jgi:hypothetical protein